MGRLSRVRNIPDRHATNFAESKESITHHKQIEQARHIHDLGEYFNTVSSECAELPPPRSARDMRLKAEEEESAAGKWFDLNEKDTKLADTEMRQMKIAEEYLSNAAQALFAMASDLDRNDIASYNIQLGEYLESITRLESITLPLSPIEVRGPICTEFSPQPL
ncbi:hypothetical protein ACWDSJ_27800 [Nocardia sp. NPDC003482]